MDFRLSVFQKLYGNPTRVTKFKVTVNMVDPNSLTKTKQNKTNKTKTKKKPKKQKQNKKQTNARRSLNSTRTLPKTSRK